MKKPAAITALLALALSATAFAQQQPITGQMMGTAASAPSAPPAANTMQAEAAAPPAPAAEAWPADPAPAATTDDAPATYYANDIGDTTRHLLQMQARGDHAAPARPMLGAEASAAWRRYLNSFEHPIPEFYETTVGKNTGNGR